MADTLSTVPLFERLPLDVRAALEAVMVDLTVKAGTVLFREGDRAGGSEGLYVIREGSLTVSVRRPAGGFSVVRTLEPGEVVGILGLVNTDHARRATVVAGSDATLSHLSRQAFLALTHGEAHMACSVYEVLAKQLVHDLREVDVALRAAITKESDSLPVGTLVKH